MMRERVEEGIYRRGGRFEVIVTASTPQGSRRQLTETVDGLREARRVRERLRAKAIAGDVAADPNVSVRAFVFSWLEHRRRLRKIRPYTERRYRELLELHAWRSIGDVKLARLDALRLQGVVDQMVDAGLDPRQTFAVLRAALRQAVRWRIIPYSPADGVELPLHRRPDLTVPTHEELERLLAGAGDITEPFRTALTLAVACGLRRSEVCGLRWSDVELDDGYLFVRRGIHAVDGELSELAPKSERSARSVEIPAAAIDVLREYRAAQSERRIALGKAWASRWEVPDVVVDDGLGHPVRPDAITRRFGRLRARLAIRGDVRLHDLRALFVTEALAAGVDAGIVSRQAGHATAGFTRDVYQRVRREDARASAEAINRAIGSAFGTPAVDIRLTKAADGVVKLRPKRR